jgi:ABC-type phosphate transport system substrate-binding protein
VSVLASALAAGLLPAPVAGGLAPAPAPADIAVVVHQKVPADNLSLAELRKVAMGDRQFWTSGLRVSILLRAPVARERDVLLKKVYRMSEAQFRQYWIAKVFRAEVPSGPKTVYSNQTALELVESLPGSVAFVEASALPKDAKVLKIDGKAPGEKGYPLQ